MSGNREQLDFGAEEEDGILPLHIASFALTPR